MKIEVRNQAKIANKYIRFAKWKVRSICRKYNASMYSEIFIRKESTKPMVFSATVKLGVPGPDLIVTSQADNLNELWAEISDKLKSKLRKYTSRKKM